MVIDWEHHYLPEIMWLKKGGKKGESAEYYEQGKRLATLHPELYDIDEHLRVMDEVGIDVAVLSMAGASDDPEQALEECRIWDDQTAEVVRRYPKRFAGLAPIPPLGGKRAFEELKRAIETLGLKGAVISAQVGGLPLDAREFYPFYEVVSTLKVPLFIHPSGRPQGLDILESPYDLSVSVGRELDLIVATTRLILGGVVDDFREIKFVISHKGGGIAALKERIENHGGFAASPAAWRGTRNRRPFGECFGELYFNLAGHYGGMNSVHCALTGISPQRMVFGTDYPQNFREAPLKIKTFIENIRKLEIAAADKEAMLGENARKLLGL